ncbi:hypothetical protein KAR91_58145 [Candidatus Pacearchaeota archaeon]|nr:hypothetical protein [Candidatus Pacearchaeota archaeon]
MGIMDYLKTEDRTKTAKDKDKKKKEITFGKKIGGRVRPAIKKRRKALAEAARED